MNHSYRIKHYGMIVLLALVHWPSLALLVKLTDLQTMAKRSDIVIHGYVGDQRVLNDELGRLITLTEVEVIEGLHGAKTGEIITVYQVGGQKNGIVMPLLGGQQFIIGQQLFFFGLKIGLKMGDAYVSYGAGQGKLDVVSNHGEEQVIEDLGDVTAISGKDSVSRSSKPSPLSFSSKVLLKEEIMHMIKSK